MSVLGFLRYCKGDNNFVIVYRVNWLRAKARRERWEEEVELVGGEMSWTVNCFKYHERMWKQMAEEARGPGQAAYAWKQNSKWKEWARSAEDTFEMSKCI